MKNQRDLWEEILDCGWIKEKCVEDRYAQNLYAAFCNMRWIPAHSFEILKDEYWSVSWRSSGGLIAEIRDCNEDYMDWYCCGIRWLGSDIDEETHEQWQARTGFVSEGFVTDEIKEDLGKLGWLPYPWPDDSSI